MKKILPVLMFGVLQFFVIAAYAQEEIKLVVRADDMGFCNAVNQACVKGYREGIITSVEVIVPGAWFMDAVQMLQENPGLDAGVHLALTSEWVNLKFGPISTAYGLTTSDGYFPSTVDEMLALKASQDAIEQEFRAQIELAQKHIPQLSHLSTHMFWHYTDSSIEQIILKLSKEYNLPINYDFTSVAYFWDTAPELKEEVLATYLDTISAGTHVFILHPMLNNDEGKAIKGTGMDPDVRVGIHRQKVTEAVMSKRIKAIIENRKIELIGHSDINK